MNSREKGKRGERLWRDELRAQGYEARRGQQFSGGADSPDVICEALPYHQEIKFVEKLNLYDAVAQAEGDAKGKPWIVAHRKSHSPWLVTMKADEWFKLVRAATGAAPEVDMVLP